MTTLTIPSTTDDLIAEIEAEAKALEWTGKWYYAGCGTVHCDYKGQDPDDHHGEVAHPEPIGAASYIASASPANVLTLIARIRELEQYKSEAIEVIAPVLDYARPLNLAKLGESITRALIADHQRLVALEQADRWRDIDEEMPEEDMRVLVWCDDGADAWPDTASQHNSFFTDEYHELLPVTHWKPVTPP